MSMWWGDAGEAEADDRRTAGTATDLVAGLVPEPDSFTARVSLPGGTQSPSAARTFVRRALRGWGMPDASVDDAMLLASELVTNAVVHAGTGVQLECRYEGSALVVEVADQHSTRAVETRAVGEDDGHPGHQGHGLRLVAALAEEWGV
ncbi:MAG TPA: ATP-binding protein, partial [Streptomyces sp.]|nr:ATP-binding protein [Streptomyces sp.]